jgi:hypothetical protein
MAIDSIYGASMRTDPLISRQRNQPAFTDNAAAAPAGTASANPAGAFTRQLPPRVLQMMQQGRETSALLSTLPGPNLGFFQPPTTLQGFGGAAPAAGGLPAAQPRINAPLMEEELQGRTTSALLSPLMDQNRRVFQPPTPPIFAGGNAAGAARGAGAAGFTPQTAGAQGAAAPLPRAGAQLLETEQAGRTTSALLSGVMGFQQPAGAFGAPSPMAGDSLTTMRAAREVIQSVDTAAPSAANMRIANEAYQMEAQAQQQYTQGVAGQGNWEWFA